MRIQIASDLHFEFFAEDQGDSFIESLNPNGVDILILSGDIVTARSTRRPIYNICRKYENSQVLYVLGNHEFYHNWTCEHVLEKAKELQNEIKNLHVLENDVFLFGNKRFLGCTLWFRNQPDNILYESRLNDFSKIRHFRNFVYKRNTESIAFLEKNTRKGDIVITHHLPSDYCVSESFRGDPLNRFFVCQMDQTIYVNEPSLWVMGHSHDSFDKTLGNTRFIRNPYGYHENETNPNFDSNLILDI